MLYSPARYMTPEERDRSEELRCIDSQLWEKALCLEIPYPEYEAARAPLEEEYDAIRDRAFDREIVALQAWCAERGMFDRPHYLVDIDAEYDFIIHEHASRPLPTAIWESDEEDDTEWPTWKREIPERARGMLIEQLGEFDADDIHILDVRDFPTLAVEYVIMPMEAAFYTRLKLTRDVFPIDADPLMPSAV